MIEHDIEGAEAIGVPGSNPDGFLEGVGTE